MTVPSARERAALLPCPFCGMPPKFECIDDVALISCNGASCVGVEVQYVGRDDAITAWNTRTAPLPCAVEKEGQTARVLKWHTDNGGHNGRLAGHALRLLHEAVELCVAAGSDRTEIEFRVGCELDKAERKAEFSIPVTLAIIREELADVSFLVDVLAHRTGNVDLAAERQQKLDVLDQRAWEADDDGVLWRPGYRPHRLTAAPIPVRQGVGKEEIAQAIMDAGCTSRARAIHFAGAILSIHQPEGERSKESTV